MDVKYWGNYKGAGDNTDLLTEQRIELFRRLLFQVTVKSILEVGCSNGYNLKAISRLGNYELTGIDIAPRAIENTNKTIADFVLGDCVNLPFKDRSFDLVLCCGFFDCYFDKNMPALTSEVIRVADDWILVVDYRGNGEPTGRITWQRRDYNDLFPGFSVSWYTDEIQEINEEFSAWLLRRT